MAMAMDVIRSCSMKLLVAFRNSTGRVTAVDMVTRFFNVVHYNTLVYHRDLNRKVQHRPRVVGF